MGASVSESAVSLSGVEVAVLRFGPAEGWPVLALHGWLDNAMSFAPLAAHLDPRARLIACDLPGHGRSGRRGAGAGYHDIEWAADVLELADALGLERFVLLGHSLGAKIATLVAGAAGARAAGLFLVEALGPARVPAEAGPHRLARYGKLRRRYRDKPPRPLPTREAAIARLVEVGVALTSANAALLAERGLVEVEGGFASAADPALQVFSPAALSEAQVAAFLGAITCPVALLTASSGFGLEPTLLAAQSACVRTLERIELEGQHYVHMDRPAEVAAELNRRLPGWMGLSPG